MKTLAIIILISLLGVIRASYEAPDDCEWTPMGGGEPGGVALTCHLSAINSRMERTDFSVIPSAGTRSLTVQCSESEAESSLEAGGFDSLVELVNLSIVGCRIDKIPADAFAGLRNLRALTVRSPRLTVEEGAFNGLDRLDALDLSDSRIRVLPANELCSVPELRVLNLAGNSFGGFGDLGVSEPCDLSRLEVLDLSKNEFSTLHQPEDEAFLSSLRGLVELKLRSNFIREFSAFELASTAPLAVLDLGLNAISSLTAETVLSDFASTLRLLSLANNTLEKASLKGLSGLEVLDLSGNKLTGGDDFDVGDLSRLIELDLSSNRLSTLEGKPFFFGGGENVVVRLETLRLDDNRLENLPARVFSNLRRLRTLDVSGNELRSIRRQSLRGLDSLTHLHLARNRIETVHDEALADSASVLVLDLSGNALNACPNALKSLTALQTLDLSFNRINSIEEAAILEMKQLWRLQLSHNRLENVSLGLLGGLKALQILDVSSNRISRVDKGAFDGNKLLQAVRLDGNALTSMDGLFANLPVLTWLNISSNAIAEFDYALVPRSLRWLDISHNVIEELSNYFDLTGGGGGISVLDAGFNRIRELGPNSVPDTVETLNVNDNRISLIAPYAFFKKTKLTKVDLTVNELKTVDRNALRLSPEVDAAALPEFYLGGNPIECDCEMVWFKSINSAAGYPIIQDIESIYCRLVYTREASFVPLVEARNEQFLCPYETHCFALCNCCDFDACDCEMTCPDNCTCFHDNSWSKNIAVCSNSEFREFPEQLPMDATEIFLDGNDLGRLDSHTFIGRKNLRSLHLNNSRIHAVKNKTFNGLRSLAVLHLEGNELTRLKGFEFETLTGLRELYLQNNLLSSVAESTFKFLRGLEVLNLKGNRIIDFPVWQLAFNPFLISAKLAENPWSCDCEFMERFRSWASAYSAKIFDAEAITCISNEAHGRNVRVADFDVSECADSMMRSAAVATTRVQELVGEDYLPLLAATLASFAVALLVLLAMFIYRHTLRVWIHSKYGLRVCDRGSFDDDDEDNVETGTLESGSEGSSNSHHNRHLFDVFLSYSPKDEVFARDVLAAELEQHQQQQQQQSSQQQQQQQGYKLCLHHRDMAPSSFVADAIVQANEASRRSVLVLSENFLKSEWSRYDYKSGLHQALRNGRPRKLIVVVLGDATSRRDLDPDLRLYLKNSVVLHWGDKLFWEKLRYALPDSPIKRNHTSVTKSDDLGHYYHQPRYNDSRPISHYAVSPPQPPVVQSVMMMPSVPGQQTTPGRTVVMHI